MIKNAIESYGVMAKGLHWLIALMIVGLLGVGLYMTDLERSPFRSELYGMHKSFGAVVLGLMLFRLFWRAVVSPAPGSVPTHAPWERYLARGVHYAFYVTLIAMPLSGWLMSSAAGHPVSVFGLFSLPDLVGQDNKALAGFMHEAHEILGNVIIALIVLHVAGVLKHLVMDRDGTLLRMLPACCSRWGAKPQA